ncbi:hypothetical protein ACHAXN_007176, partial [Cyclotella atomus]
MIRLEPALHQLNSLLHAQKLEAGKPKVAAAKGGAMPKIKSHVGSDDETKKFSNVITPTLKGIETKGAGGDSFDSAVDQLHGSERGAMTVNSGGKADIKDDSAGDYSVGVEDLRRKVDAAVAQVDGVTVNEGDAANAKFEPTKAKANG